MAFYCVTKSREPTTNESDMFSALACTLFVSVNDSCCEYFLINVKLRDFWILNAKSPLFSMFTLLHLFNVITRGCQKQSSGSMSKN